MPIDYSSCGCLSLCDSPNMFICREKLKMAKHSSYIIKSYFSPES